MNRALLDAFAESSWTARAHVTGRWKTCPFEAVNAVVPRAGRILEYGCGLGVFASYAAVDSPQREVVGVDVDARKIDVAKSAASRVIKHGGHLSVRAIAPNEVPPGPWDAIVVIDVLYLLDAETQRQILGGLAGQLSRTGILVIKEMATDPAWKYYWNVVQETVSVRLLRITQGRRFCFTPPDQLAGWLRDCGLLVRQRKVDRGQMHPHHLTEAFRDPVPPVPV